MASCTGLHGDTLIWAPVVIGGEIDMKGDIDMGAI